MADLFSDLFEQDAKQYKPLADALRPKKLKDMLGQVELIGDNQPLAQMIENKQLQSVIFWGPPGVGKTTLAQLLSRAIDAHFVPISAVTAGVKDLRELFAQAKVYRQSHQKHTVLFIDEIHRFSKSQQDVILPFVESGIITLIGATTENPSFALNNAVLSRVIVYHLKSLSLESLIKIIKSGLEYLKNNLNLKLNLSQDQLNWIAQKADGDARRALNFVELLSQFAQGKKQEKLSDEDCLALLKTQPHRYDNKGDIYYEQISAFHKSVRGSSPDGALYWLARMLTSGCDPLYIARRLVAIASEDIGNADPRALQIVMNAWDAFERIGFAEGHRAIAHAAVYCACAPKSNSIELAFNKAIQLAKKYNSLPVPDHLCNAPTELLKNMGKHQNYRYSHDEPYSYSAGQSYLPDELKNNLDSPIYEPKETGLEKQIKARLDFLKGLDHKK